MGFSWGEKKRYGAATLTNPEHGSDNATILKHKIAFFASQFIIIKRCSELYGHGIILGLTTGEMPGTGLSGQR